MTPSNNDVSANFGKIQEHPRLFQGVLCLTSCDSPVWVQRIFQTELCY